MLTGFFRVQIHVQFFVLCVVFCGNLSHPNVSRINVKTRVALRENPASPRADGVSFWSG